MNRPRHCAALRCNFLKKERFSSQFDYVCAHPEGVREEPTLVESCPRILNKIKNNGFLEKCIKCPEFESDIHSGGIDIWCIDDRQLDCVKKYYEDLGIDLLEALRDHPIKTPQEVC
jgi:hypothetical protein